MVPNYVWTFCYRTFPRLFCSSVPCMAGIREPRIRLTVPHRDGFLQILELVVDKPLLGGPTSSGASQPAGWDANNSAGVVDNAPARSVRVLKQEIDHFVPAISS